MATKIEFLMTTSGVFLSDLPCSFFSVLYRKTPRALWSYLRDSIFELFLSAAPTGCAQHVAPSSLIPDKRAELEGPHFLMQTDIHYIKIKSNQL